ncbi:MAG: hypothetical protein ACRDPM_17945 [Solirubrobacteraceae bacterium]
MSGLLFGAVLVAVAQGSVTVVSRAPSLAQAESQLAWERWCTRGQARTDRQRLAWCARVQGRVVWTTQGPSPGELHLAVIGGFHLTIVRMPYSVHHPSVGSALTAVGPLVRARNGQRELQAFMVRPG